MKAHPLVSILVPNYNYGRYLPTCLESAVNQTYENLQVVFVDNHSTDDSWDIALEFQSRYPDRLRVYRNDENIGGARNHGRARSLIDPRTQYIIYLSSDDYFHLSLVDRCMGIIEDHPSVGFVICHRNAVDAEGNVTAELPFYNCDCVIPSTLQMEVFMMAGIGVSTQCFRSLAIDNIVLASGGYFFDIAGDWFYNFGLATLSDMGYIQDPLCTYRTHTSNVTNGAIRNLTNSLEHVRMIHAFRDIASALDRPSVAQRFRPAIEKLGSMCLRYSTQLLKEADNGTATRYLHLACVLKPSIREDPSWKALRDLKNLRGEDLRQGLAQFQTLSPQKRLIAYDPPEGSIRL